MINIYSVVRYLQISLMAVLLATFCTVALADKVNLNQADAEALQYIPGIGPGKSLQIIETRERVGGFKTMEDLLKVPGIGTKVLEQIRQHGALDTGVSTLSEEMKENPPGKSASVTKQPTSNQSG